MIPSPAELVPLDCNDISRNAAMRSAYRAGIVARAAGRPITGNPYGDTRTYNGMVTFARAFWRAWRAGWEDTSWIDLGQCRLK